MQSAELTLNGADPKVAYRCRSPTSNDVFTVRYAWIFVGAWQRQTVYDVVQTSAAIDITWHPTEGKRVYYALISGTDRAHLATKPGRLASRNGRPGGRSGA